MDNNSKEYVRTIFEAGFPPMGKLIVKIIESEQFRGFSPVQIGASIRTIYDEGERDKALLGKDLFKAITDRYGPPELLNTGLLFKDLSHILDRLKHKLY
jgi:hypothetical protein